MSTGEFQFITLFSRLNVAKNILENFDKYKGIRNVNFENLIVILDEGETYFHPQWQKEYLRNLIDSIPKFFPKYKIQLILTSHSPSILSDLPKENIIFLDTYKSDDEDVKSEKQKQGNCKVIPSKNQAQTFGQNIHTLLSDAFFMSEGLIGDFARQKIEDVFKFIEDGKSENIANKEDCLKIINIIGEPMIKNKLQQLFSEKFPEYEIDLKIKQLQSEIKELKKMKRQ